MLLGVLVGTGLRQPLRFQASHLQSASPKRLQIHMRRQCWTTSQLRGACVGRSRISHPPTQRCVRQATVGPRLHRVAIEATQEYRAQVFALEVFVLTRSKGFYIAARSANSRNPRCGGNLVNVAGPTKGALPNNPPAGISNAEGFTGSVGARPSSISVLSSGIAGALRLAQVLGAGPADWQPSGTGFCTGVCFVGVARHSSQRHAGIRFPP